LFAVKALSKRAMLQKKKGVAHVMQELNILRSCAHPFVIKLNASFQTKHWLCHLMEFCPRGHFYSLLQAQDKKRLPEDSARFYAAEILSGIEYLHINGFIYRDMKPENILVAASGHLRLTDFDLSQTADELATPITVGTQGVGVSQKEHDRLLLVTEKHNSRAKDVSAEAAQQGCGSAAEKSSTAQAESSAAPSDTPSTPSAPTPARFDSFVGTIEYMAPEVVQGTGHSFAVDFWVFGVMVYEMLYGVTPFRGQDAKRTFEDVLYKQTKSASFYKHPLCEEPRPRVSSNAKDLIAKLLVKNEKKRLGYEHGVAEIKSHPWFRNVKWDLQRNQEPPLMPPAKNVSIRERQLEPLKKIFQQLDKEEKKKILAAKAKRAAKRAEKGEAASPEVAIDRSGANNPERLRGFVYVEEAASGTDWFSRGTKEGAYGNDATGRKKLIEGMAAEAGRRAAAQQPFSLEVHEASRVADGSSVPGGLIFASTGPAVVTGVVPCSAAAAEPKLLRNACTLIGVNGAAVDENNWRAVLHEAVAGERRPLTLQFEPGATHSASAVAHSGAESGDSRTSIAWNSAELSRGSSRPDTDAEAGRRMLEVTVPAGAGPGETMLVHTPDGNQVQAVVPEGVHAGMALRIVVPAAPEAPEPASEAIEASSTFEAALQALQAGDYSEAESRFESVLLAQSGHEEARAGLEQARRGVALGKLGAAGLQQMLERMASEASTQGAALWDLEVLPVVPSNSQ